MQNWSTDDRNELLLLIESVVKSAVVVAVKASLARLPATHGGLTPCSAAYHHDGRLRWNRGTGVYTCECGQRYMKDGAGGLRDAPVPIAGGALTVVSVAAATAVVGYDLLSNRPDIQVSARDRVLRGVGLTGSAAGGDAAVDFKVGATIIASLFNSATGFPSNDASKFDTQYLIPAGAPLSVIVTDAPATNDLNALIDV